MDCASVRIVVNVKPDKPRMSPAPTVAIEPLQLPVSAHDVGKFCAPGDYLAAC
jgi:hypothetical protein